MEYIMDFLMCRPYVAVVSKNYQIVIITKEKGLISVVIDDKRFFAENDGVLSSEKNYAKIEIPQSVLDCSKKYTVAFAKTIERKSYFSQFEKEVYTEFAFKVLNVLFGNFLEISATNYEFPVCGGHSLFRCDFNCFGYRERR